MGDRVIFNSEKRDWSHVRRVPNLQWLRMVRGSEAVCSHFDDTAGAVPQKARASITEGRTDRIVSYVKGLQINNCVMHTLLNMKRN